MSMYPQPEIKVTIQRRVLLNLVTIPSSSSVCVRALYGMPLIVRLIQAGSNGTDCSIGSIVSQSDLSIISWACWNGGDRGGGGDIGGVGGGGDIGGVSGIMGPSQATSPSPKVREKSNSLFLCSIETLTGVSELISVFFIPAGNGFGFAMALCSS